MTIENLNKIMDLPKTKELFQPITKRASINPIDNKPINDELVIDKKPQLRTPRLSLGSPQQITDMKKIVKNKSLYKTNKNSDGGKSNDFLDTSNEFIRKTSQMSKMSNTSRGFNLLPNL